MRKKEIVKNCSLLTHMLSFQFAIINGLLAINGEDLVGHFKNCEQCAATAKEILDGQIQYSLTENQKKLYKASLRESQNLPS